MHRDPRRKTGPLAEAGSENVATNDAQKTGTVEKRLQALSRRRTAERLHRLGPR